MEQGLYYATSGGKNKPKQNKEKNKEKKEKKENQGNRRRDKEKLYQNQHQEQEMARRIKYKQRYSDPRTHNRRDSPDCTGSLARHENCSQRQIQVYIQRILSLIEKGIVQVCIEGKSRRRLGGARAKNVAKSQETPNGIRCHNGAKEVGEQDPDKFWRLYSWQFIFLDTNDRAPVLKSPNGTEQLITRR